MPNISDLIERFILNVIGESREIIINRNNLADRFDCASSQINYVLSTRFTADKGYAKESKRGGGGYIRLYRMVSGGDYFKKLMDEIKDKPLAYNKCVHIAERMALDGAISEREAAILLSVLSDRALKEAEDKDAARNDSMTEALTGLWKRRNEGEAAE